MAMISDKLSAAAEQADAHAQDALAGAQEAAANGLSTASEAVTNAGAPSDVPAAGEPAEIPRPWPTRYRQQARRDPGQAAGVSALSGVGAPRLRRDAEGGQEREIVGLVDAVAAADPRAGQAEAE